MSFWESATSKMAAYPGVSECGDNFCCVRQTLAWPGTRTKPGAVCDVSVDGLPTFGVCLDEAACLAKSADAVLFDALPGACATCCVVPSLPLPRMKDDAVVTTWKLPSPCLIGQSIGDCMTESACLKKSGTFSYPYECPDASHNCCMQGEAEPEETVTLTVDGRPVVFNVSGSSDPADCSKGGVPGFCGSQAECAAERGRTAWPLGGAGVDGGCRAEAAGQNFCCVENPPAVATMARPTTMPRPATPRPVPPPGAPAPMIRVSGVPTRSCNLVTPVCSSMYNACGNNIIFDEEFMPFVSEYNRCAALAGTRIGICSTYRNIAHNRRVGGASSSNHLVGHAIDFQVRDRNGGVCNEACLLSRAVREARPGVKETLACIDAIRGSAWGGNPATNIRIRGHLDVVHCDDRINTRAPSAHVAKRTACNADRVFQRVSCDSYSLASRSFLGEEGEEEPQIVAPADQSAPVVDVALIAGASVGAVVVALAIVAVVVYVVVKRKRTAFHIES